MYFKIMDVEYIIIADYIVICWINTAVCFTESVKKLTEIPILSFLWEIFLMSTLITIL